MSDPKETRKILRDLGVKRETRDLIKKKNLTMRKIRRFDRSELKNLFVSRTDRKNVEEWIKANSSRRHKEDKKRDKSKRTKTKETRSNKYKSETRSKTSKKEKEKKESKKKNDRKKNQTSERKHGDREKKTGRKDEKKKREGDDRKRKKKRELKMTADDAKRLVHDIRNEEGLIMISRIHLGKEYMDCFLSKDLIAEIVTVKGVRKRNAIEMGQKLLEFGYISGFKGETTFDEKRAFYTFKKPSEKIEVQKVLIPSTNKHRASMSRPSAARKATEKMVFKKSSPKPLQPPEPPKSEKEVSSEEQKPSEEKPVKQKTKTEEEKKLEALEKRFEEERKKREQLERKLAEQAKAQDEFRVQKDNSTATTSTAAATSAASTAAATTTAATTAEVALDDKSNAESEYDEYSDYEYYSEYSEYSDESYSEVEKKDNANAQAAVADEDKSEYSEYEASSASEEEVKGVKGIVGRYEKMKERCVNCFIDKDLSEIADVDGESVCKDCFEEYVQNLSSEEEEMAPRNEILERLKKQGAKDFTMDTIEPNEIRCARCNDVFPYTTMSRYKTDHYCKVCIAKVMKKQKNIQFKAKG